VKTIIAIPCMEHMHVGFVESLVYLEKENVSVAFKPNSLIYDSRNLLSLMALENKFDRVLWLDSDMMFTPKTLKILNKDMDDLQCDMVSGLYFKRVGKSPPVIYDELEMPGKDENGFPIRHIHEYVDYPKNSIFPVKGCGFGCVLTSAKLFQEGWDKFGPAFSPFPWAGEDIAFCHRVNMLGHTIYCDSNVTCGHIGTYVYTEETFEAKRGDVT